MRDIDRFNQLWSPSHCGYFVKGAPDPCRLWRSDNFRFKGITASRWIYSHSVKELSSSDTLYQMCQQLSCVNPRHMIVQPKDTSPKPTHTQDESYYDRRKRIGGGALPVLCRNSHVVEDDGAIQCRECNKERQRKFRAR